MRSQQFWLVACLGLVLSACQLVNPNDNAHPQLDIIELQFGEENITTQALINSGLQFSNPSTSFETLGNVCYLSTTYTVVNTTGTNLANFSLVAVSAPGNIGGTAVRGLKGAAGNAVTDPAIYRSITPSNRVVAVANQPQVIAGAADYQVFLPAEADNLQPFLPADVNVLEYGYVARNTDGGRVIRDGESGTVTIAVQYPCETSITGGTPFSFSMTFAFTDFSVPRFTRGPNETTAELEQRIINTYGAPAIPPNLEIVLVGSDNDVPIFGTAIRISDVERIADTPLPSPVPSFLANVLSAELYSFECSDDEVSISASGAARISFGNTTIYVGGRQVTADNQDPRITRFDKGVQTWCLGNLETSGDDSKGYGLVWDGANTIYAVFSATGTQGEPVDDFRRFAVNGWLPSYGPGGGARVAVLVRIDLVSGNPITATYLSARRGSDGNTNSLTVTGLEITTTGEVVVRAETSAFPRSTNPSVSIDCPAYDGLVEDYTLVLSADLSTAISATAPSCSL